MIELLQVAAMVFAAAAVFFFGWLCGSEARGKFDAGEKDGSSAAPLLPARVRAQAGLTDEAALKLFSTVTENDNCLRVINEILAERLLQSAIQAGDINASDTNKLRACERMECFRMLLAEIEMKREQAAEWREEQNRKTKEKEGTG